MGFACVCRLKTVPFFAKTFFLYFFFLSFFDCLAFGCFPFSKQSYNKQRLENTFLTFWRWWRGRSGRKSSIVFGSCLCLCRFQCARTWLGAQVGVVSSTTEFIRSNRWISTRDRKSKDMPSHHTDLWWMCWKCVRYFWPMENHKSNRIEWHRAFNIYFDLFSFSSMASSVDFFRGKWLCGFRLSF